MWQDKLYFAITSRTISYSFQLRYMKEKSWIHWMLEFRELEEQWYTLSVGEGNYFSKMMTSVENLLSRGGKSGARYRHGKDNERSPERSEHKSNHLSKKLQTNKKLFLKQMISLHTTFYNNPKNVKCGTALIILLLYLILNQRSFYTFLEK